MPFIVMRLVYLATQGENRGVCPGALLPPHHLNCRCGLNGYDAFTAGPSGIPTVRNMKFGGEKLRKSIFSEPPHPSRVFRREPA